MGVSPWLADAHLMFAADPIKGVFKGQGVVFAIGKLYPIIRQYDVDPIRHRCDQIAQELGCGQLSRLRNQLRESELGCSVNGHEEIELAFCGAHLSQIDVEVPDRIAFETLLAWFVSIDIRQATDAMPLQTKVQRGPRQMRDRGLKRVETTIQGQQSMPPKCDDDGLFFFAENREYPKLCV